MNENILRRACQHAGRGRNFGWFPVDSGYGRLLAKVYRAWVTSETLVFSDRTSQNNLEHSTRCAHCTNIATRLRYSYNYSLLNKNTVVLTHVKKLKKFNKFFTLRDSCNRRNPENYKHLSQSNKSRQVGPLASIELCCMVRLRPWSSRKINFVVLNDPFYES